MAEQFCVLRSLWQTLTAAASTYALFVAANWGMAEFLQESSLLSKIAGHVMLAFGMPLFPLCVSVANACKVRMVQSRLGPAAATLDYRSIAVITLCHIYIQIPSALAEKMPAMMNRLRITMSQEELENHVCPLELLPPRRRRQGARATMDTAQGHEDASALVTEDSQWVWLELCSTALVSELYASEHELGYRAALLSTGLAPNCKDLCILRARNRFQSLITALQAGGCVLGVVERMVQHLGISPVEAIVTSLSIMVAFQLLVELYACGNYQRPLLLRLDAEQFARFCDAPMIDFKVLIRRYLFIAAATFFLVWLLISIPVIYYFFYYVHTHLICAVSALLFFLAQMLTTMFFFRETCFDTLADVLDNVEVTLVISSWLLFASSMILAVVATIVDWKAFHHPSLHKWFAWILPHVSS